MMNKFLHPTLQAIKAAAAEGDVEKLESYRATFDPSRAAAYSSRILRVRYVPVRGKLRQSPVRLMEGANSEESS